MNILMVLEGSFPPDIRVENEIEQLNKLGHKVVVACLAADGTEETITYKGTNTVLRHPISAWRKKTSVGALNFPFYFSFWRRLVSGVLQKYSIDALHIHDLPLLRVGLQLKKVYNLPLVVDLHENWPALMAESPHTKTLLGRLLHSHRQWEDYEKDLAGADAVITVVEEMKARIAQKGVPQDKLYVLSNFLNISSFPIVRQGSQQVVANRPLQLFYGGGLNRHRGLQVVIEGLSLLPASLLWRCTIVGGGNYEHSLKAMVQQYGLQHRVIFEGVKPQDELLRMMMQSDIALIPHLRSVQTDCSSPNKLYQYMYAQKPLLVANCQSLNRLVGIYNVGYVYTDNSPKDFAQQLSKLLQSPADLATFASSGRQWVEQSCNWDKQREVLKTIYSTIVQ